MRTGDEDEAVLVGAAISRHRKALRWSQATLAERVNLSVDQIGLVERGLRLPSVGALIRLAKVLGTGMDELLGSAGMDPWEREVLAVARAIPQSGRDTALAMLRGAAAMRPKGEAPSTSHVRLRSRR